MAWYLAHSGFLSAEGFDALQDESVPDGTWWRECVNWLRLTKNRGPPPQLQEASKRFDTQIEKGTSNLCLMQGALVTQLN